MMALQCMSFQIWSTSVHSALRTRPGFVRLCIVNWHLFSLVIRHSEYLTFCLFFIFTFIRHKNKVHNITVREMYVSLGVLSVIWIKRWWLSHWWQRPQQMGLISRDSISEKWWSDFDWSRALQPQRSLTWNIKDARHVVDNALVS